VHKVFGIRHHGPGSAKNVLRALEEFQPDCILIEAPADAEKVIPLSAHKKMKLPLAILIYNPADFNQAAFYPFAKFSPEWQALQYGHKHKLEMGFIDLPQSQGLLLPEENEYSTDLDIADPLGNLAKIAGFKDSERWWDFTFEYAESGMEIFALIEDMVSALRKEIIDQERETLLREAYMRNQIRNAIKNNYERIAVICGAWHVPTLNDLSLFTLKEDRALLKGLKKIKTDATWIPWTYERLARSGGYAAGVDSPAWYDLIFNSKKDSATRWLTKAARLLRKSGLDASSANIIEAVNLSKYLAAMRDIPLPGLIELKEAALSTLCNGLDIKFNLIENKLIIGDKVGRLPKNVPTVPLQKDVLQQIKKARLSKEFNSSEATTKKLDLRKPTGLLGSKLIHRLSILDIPFGKARKGSRFATGSFSETWKLKWKPEYSIRVIEASMWGNDVEEATRNYVVHNVRNESKLERLSELLEMVLKADLPLALSSLLQQISQLAVLQSDTNQLMVLVPQLIDAMRYGSTRKLDVIQIEEILKNVLPRIMIGLPATCIGINEDQANEIYEKIQRMNHSIFVLKNADYIHDWYQVLIKIAEQAGSHTMLNALTHRILFERKIYSSEKVSKRMHYQLSVGAQSMEQALWIEGFLYGSAMILIHHYPFWKIVDDWLDEVEESHFMEIVPVLRRTFAEFTPAEKRKLIHYARNGRHEKPREKRSLNQERIGVIMPVLEKIFIDK